MRYFTEADGNGKIVAWWGTDHSMSGLVEVGREPDPENDYISGGVLVARPSFSLALSKSTIVADGTDKANLTGVPSGAVVTMERSGGGSRSATADGTTVEITATMPGNYVVTVSKWPYRDGVFGIAATV